MGKPGRAGQPKRIDKYPPQNFNPADEALGVDLVCCMALSDDECAATPLRHCEGLKSAPPPASTRLAGED